MLMWQPWLSASLGELHWHSMSVVNIIKQASKQASKPASKQASKQAG